MAKKTAKKSARKPNAAFMKPMHARVRRCRRWSAAKPIPRTEVTKKLWAYIKKNKLQDQQEQADDQGRRRAEGRLRRQGHGQHVRDDQACEQAPEVGLGPPVLSPGPSLTRVPGGRAVISPFSTTTCPFTMTVREALRVLVGLSAGRPMPEPSRHRRSAMSALHAGAAARRGR